MAVIHYKGHKERMSVTFPIGEHRMGVIDEVKWADPYLEMSDEDAAKLVSIDSHNFEIVPAMPFEKNPGDGATPLTEKRKAAKPKKAVNG